MAEHSPVAHHALSVHALESAASLARAVYLLRQRLNNPPPGLSEAKLSERNILLTLSIRQLESERDSALDALAAHWTTYRRIE